jgi:glycosyltransferase involved in cell wall biosynthesis
VKVCALPGAPHQTIRFSCFAPSCNLGSVPQDLLRAFAKCQSTNARLVFAGDGPLRSQLEAEASTLGVAARVRFLGFVNQSQLPAVYKSADLMVLLCQQMGEEANRTAQQHTWDRNAAQTWKLLNEAAVKKNRPVAPKEIR